MNTNIEKAKEIADCYCYTKYLLPNDKSKRFESSFEECYASALKMAEYKDIELKNQEQSLLWTLYSILDNLAAEGEAREHAINEFKEHLDYYKGD